MDKTKVQQNIGIFCIFLERQYFSYHLFKILIRIFQYLNPSNEMLNIPSTVVDSNYRYRMPKMQLKIQSKGNGIKTNIVNLQDVAKHLRTDEGYILKFFGFEKASQTIQKSSQTKSKQAAKTNTSYIIQGSFTDEDLLKSLDKFIDKYILCPKCKLPELNMYISNDRINGKCDSCPFNGEIDNKHKLTAYILKNPPSYKPQNIKATKIIDKEITSEHKTEKTDKTDKTEHNGKNAKAAEVKVQEGQKTQEAASKLFSADTLEFGSPELEKLVEYTKKFIETRKKQDFDISSAETVQCLKPLGLKKTLMAYVLFNALFTINIVKQVQQNAPMYKKLMKRLVSNSEQNNEIETLLNLQYLFLEVNKERDFTKFMPTILYKIYEAGLLSKQVVMKWWKKQIKDIQKFFLYNEARNQQLCGMCKDFIESLEDDSDEEAEKAEKTA